MKSSKIMRKYGLIAATSIVISNMIGTGIFTSLGFQLMDIRGGFSIVVLWLLGVMLSLFGAFAYSELGAIYPESGGEYNYLTKIYHPSLGFLAGWISFLIGFAAPVAAASFAFSIYLSESFHIKSLFGMALSVNTISIVLSSLLVITLSAIHSYFKKTGSVLQVAFTVIKITAILFLIAVGLFHGKSTSVSFLPNALSLKEIFAPAFAISMFFVTYSYSGWNASSYLAGEIENPKKNLPLSLIIGTLIVTLLYIFLNVVFMYIVPADQLAGKLEIGYIYASTLFGVEVGKYMGAVISILLISSISSMVLVGPRVNEALGKNMLSLKYLSKRNKKDVPHLAILTQAVFSLVYIFTSTFDRVIVFIGFSLNLFTLLTVIGVLVLRIKQPRIDRKFRMLGYPITWVFFLIVNTWVLIYGLIYKPQESIFGLGICVIGLILYFGEDLYKRKKKKAIVLPADTVFDEPVNLQVED